MRSTFLLALFSIISVAVLGQNTSISGKVLDGDQPLSFATVVLYSHPDSSIAKVEYTDDEGWYRLDAPAGDYYLESSLVGMQTMTSDVIKVDGTQDIEMPVMSMISSSNELEEVVVKAKKPIVQILPDKTVFNVEGNMNSSGNSALELLRKSPGVVIDNNENIVLRGKSGVIIYINGKRSMLTGEDLVAYLRSLRSEDIKAIEIITSPSAKYDAEGNAGILNIELKREKGLGTSGSASLGYALGITPKYNGSVRVNNRSKKFNTYGSYSYFNGDMENTMNIVRNQDNDQIVQRNVQVHDRESHNFRTGLDYFVSEKHTVGLLFHGYVMDGSRRSRINSEIFDKSQGSKQFELEGMDFGENDRNNFNFNLNYAWSPSENTSLNMDLDYGIFEADNFSFQPNDYVDANTGAVFLEQDYTTVAPTQIDIYSGKIDYETKLGKGKFGAGAKYASVRSDNDFSFFNHEGSELVLDTDRSNDFAYTENVTAIYSNYSYQAEKWGFQAGLRMENTESEGVLEAISDVDNKNVKRSYLDFFPSAGLTYQLNQSNSFRMSYSRRIDRPNYQNLNPFEFRLDELTFRKGNPFLNPQYTNAIELSHQFKYKLNTSISYSKTTDLMTQLTDTAGVRESFISFLNLAEQTNVGVNISYPFSPKEWWSIFANFSANRIVNQGSFEGTKVVDVKVTSANLYVQNAFTLPDDWSVELSGFYQSPSVWGGNFETEAIGSVDIGVTKKIMQGKGIVKASLSDMFLTMPWSATNSLGILQMDVNGRWESRQLRLNFTYQFGHSDVKNSRRRSTGLENETKRLEQEGR